MLGWTLLGALIILNLFVVLSGKTYFYKAVVYNLAGVDDYKLFENRKISKSDSPQPWPIGRKYNQYPITPKLRHTLDSLQTFAFVVIKNDSLVHEEYHDGYSDSSYSNSFSVAKSVVRMLIGVALKEGKIKSIDDPVGTYLEEFKNEGKEKITLRHLLTMSSGLNWDESYSSPFSMTTEAYYGTDLPKLVSRLKVIEEPGKQFKYLSGNTLLMAMVVEKVTGKRISDYLQEKLWQPLGMEHDAMWSLDHKDGLEKAYCCINSNARDFAKLGSLYLHYGNWHGQQLVDSGFVSESIKPASLTDPEDDHNAVSFYGLQWWLVPNSDGIFYARGILGQYIFVIPSKDLVVVRLGQKRGNKKKKDVLLTDVAVYLKEIQETF